jgi:energy-coupling factor transporter transmembrane protein EcfT
LVAHLKLFIPLYRSSYLFFWHLINAKKKKNLIDGWSVTLKLTLIITSNFIYTRTKPSNNYIQ